MQFSEHFVNVMMFELPAQRSIERRIGVGRPNPRSCTLQLAFWRRRCLFLTPLFAFLPQAVLVATIVVAVFPLAWIWRPSNERSGIQNRTSRP